MIIDSSIGSGSPKKIGGIVTLNRSQVDDKRQCWCAVCSQRSELIDVVEFSPFQMKTNRSQHVASDFWMIRVSSHV
jgi:hypothetical protein